MDIQPISSPNFKALITSDANKYSEEQNEVLSKINNVLTPSIISDIKLNTGYDVFVSEGRNSSELGIKVARVNSTSENNRGVLQKVSFNTIGYYGDGVQNVDNSLIKKIYDTRDKEKKESEENKRFINKFALGTLITVLAVFAIAYCTGKKKSPATNKANTEIIANTIDTTLNLRK